MRALLYAVAACGLISATLMLLRNTKRHKAGPRGLVSSGIPGVLFIAMAVMIWIVAATDEGKLGVVGLELSVWAHMILTTLLVAAYALVYRVRHDPHRQIVPRWIIRQIIIYWVISSVLMTILLMIYIY